MVTADSISLESGYDNTVKPLISLGGFKGLPGKGRIIRTSVYVVTSTGGSHDTIASDNPKRIALSITNNTPGDVAILQIGQSGQSVVYLAYGDTLLINENFPTTAQITCSAQTSSVTMLITEFSVQ